MGGSWLTVVARDGRLLAVSHRQREYVREESSAGLLETLSGWPLEPRECAGVLLADLPARLALPVAAAEEQVGYEVMQTAPEDGLALRRYVYARGPAQGEAGAVLRIEAAGRTLAEVTYLSWSVREGLPVPARLSLRDERGILELRLASLDAGAPASAFELAPPQGFERRPLPEAGLDLPYWGDPEAGS